MRPPTACVACRNRRRKCEVLLQGHACVYCRNRNQQCSFTSTSLTQHRRTNSFQKETSPRSGSGSIPIAPEAIISDDTELDLLQWPTLTSSTNLGLLPPQDILEECTMLYFQYIHDTFHSIFHKPSLMQDVRIGNVPRIILLSLVSLAARFSSNSYFAGTDPRVRGREYARAAESLLDIRDISVHTIQSCVLLGAYAITEGEAAAESLYYSIACRLAMILDLPNMVVTTRLEQETNIRIWWTLCMIDVWSSNGIRLPRSIVPRDNVPFPIEETAYLDMRRENFGLPSPTLRSESISSLLTQMIKLNAILVEIGELNRAAASALSSVNNQQHSQSQQPIGAGPPNFNMNVDHLTAKLDMWYTSLPPQLKDTPENLQHYSDLGLGYFFVAVYLGYYHYGQLLYYQYLHEDTHDIDADPSAPHDSHAHGKYYANKCKDHATALCSILYRAYSTSGCEVYYTMVGHVLVIASTVQLHILLFSSDLTQVSAARQRLESNFEILTRLQTYWPTLDVCFSRFREFHKACQRSKESSFRMDRWMIQFLFEFAKPIEEEEGRGREEVNVGELREWRMEDLGFSPYGL